MTLTEYFSRHYIYARHIVTEPRYPENVGDLSWFKEYLGDLPEGKPLPYELRLPKFGARLTGIIYTDKDGLVHGTAKQNFLDFLMNPFVRDMLVQNGAFGMGTLIYVPEDANMPMSIEDHLVKVDSYNVREILKIFEKG